MKKCLNCFLFLIFSCFTLLGLTACGKVEATSLNIIEDEVVLFLGQSKQLKYEFQPEGVNSLVLEWTSSNPKQVSVNKYGIIKSLDSYCTVTITLKDKTTGLSDSCKVTVNDGEVYNIKVDTSELDSQYFVGQTFDASKLKIYGLYQSGVAKLLPQDEYILNCPDILALDSKISVTYLNWTKDIEISIIEDYVTGISITKNPDKTAYLIGETFDSTGMEVSLNWASGKVEKIESFTYNTKPIRYNASGVEVFFNDYSITCPISVSPTTTISNISLLQDAINNANVGDGIMIKSGIYQNNKTITIPLSKNLTIYGEDDETILKNVNSSVFKLVNDITDSENHYFTLAYLNISALNTEDSIVTFDKENSTDNLKNFEFDILKCNFDLQTSTSALSFKNKTDENLTSTKHEYLVINISDSKFTNSLTETYLNYAIDLAGINGGSLNLNNVTCENLNNAVNINDCENFNLTCNTSSISTTNECISLINTTKCSLDFNNIVNFKGLPIFYFESCQNLNVSGNTVLMLGVQNKEDLEENKNAMIVLVGCQNAVINLEWSEFNNSYPNELTYTKALVYLVYIKDGDTLSSNNKINITYSILLASDIVENYYIIEETTPTSTVENDNSVVA